jgi:tetratricopeptide (TPR) repeat protein
MMRRTALTAGVLTAILLPLAGAYAQSQPRFDATEAERQERLVEEQRKAGEISRKALPAEENITYADVLNDPDNIDLNFRYAKSQIAHGNVHGAASTLERTLLVTPDLPQVRLMYAVVLFHLDNIDESERELKALKKLKMEPGLEADIDRFLKAIQQRRQLVNTRITASFGVKRDSNVNAGPRTGQALAVSTPFQLSTDAEKKKDYAFLGIVSGEVRKDLGHQTRGELILGATYYHDEQIAVDSQELQSGTVSVAAELIYVPFTVTPKVSYTNLSLSREQFYASYGA